MSTEATRKMIRAYEQRIARPTMFLSGLFETSPENFFDTEEVEIDVVRTDEDISVAIQDLSTGYRMNSLDEYTNKSFKPPIHKEAFPVNAFDLLKREPGANPFDQPDFAGRLIPRIFRGMSKIENKIRRAMEEQASQVLQDGTVTLKDENGNSVYSIDYKPKATHFVAASNDWGTANGDPAADIESLANVIRNDGLADPDQLIMGETAFEKAITNETFRERFETRRIDLGSIGAMEMRGQGGTFRGTVQVGNYSYDVWTYAGRFKDPQTGVVTKFIKDDNVIVRASAGRMDALFGAIPNIGRLLGAQRQGVVPGLPGRVSLMDGGADMFVNTWLTDDGEQLFAGVGGRPLMVPTAIDTFGRIDTTP